jgi:hypothetical protein
MKEYGFTFDTAGEGAFIRQYGVFRESQWYDFEGGKQGNRNGQAGKPKELPGVSPLVFTQYLLENAAFISLEDIGAGLPAYEETPVPIDMDTELAINYAALEETITGVIRNRNNGGRKILSQLINTLSVYPDTPYDQPQVIHPDTGRVIITPQNLSRETRRNKEQALIDIVREKVANGEKVLVYYSWVNRSDLGRKLPEILEAEGFKAVTMTASVKNSEREAWIQKNVTEKDIDVLIVNPSLVETGLDLLDFTTIVFYQVGYNLFTMRQASRRSWRLSQTKDVQVYFLYYRGTVQEQALSLMATKLQAAMAIEGKFSEEGLNAMSNNEDIMTQIAASVADGIKDTVDTHVFSAGKVESTQIEVEEDHRLILTPAVTPIATKLESYRNGMKSSKKRAGLKALGINENNLMNNLSQLFAAV